MPPNAAAKWLTGLRPRELPHQHLTTGFPHPPDLCEPGISVADCRDRDFAAERARRAASRK